MESLLPLPGVRIQETNPAMGCIRALGSSVAKLMILQAI